MRNLIFRNTPELYKLLDTEQIEFTEYSNGRELKVLDDLSAQDILEMGIAIGREKFSEKPEEYWMQPAYVELLKKAIAEYQKETHSRVDTFQFGPSAEGWQGVKVTVYPTTGVCLQGIYSKYGQLVERHKEEL